MKKLFSLVVLATCLVLVPGCRHNNTNPKVVYAATILDAASASDTFSQALGGAQSFSFTIRNEEPAYYARIHPQLVKLAEDGIKLDRVLRAAKAGDTSADWRSAMNAIVADGQDIDPAAFGFKNPSSAASAKIIFASVIASINAISASFGGK